jgi:hypothetical protein
MFDESYCAGMALGAPEVSIKALNELATALGSLAENRTSCAGSCPSTKEEEEGAGTPKAKSRTVSSRSRCAKSQSPIQAEPQGAHRGIGRSSAGVPRSRAVDEEGR